MNPANITVVILTRNEERNLPRALAAVPKGAHVLVVDAHSTDRTAEIARAAGAGVIEREWRGFIDARSFALSAVRTAWTFMLDADEEPDARLRAAIEAAPEDADGYTVARTTYFCGRPMRIWSGERIVRLFRTGSARLRSKAMSDSAEVHEVWSVPGVVKPLAGELRHYSYDSVASYRDKFERYSDLEARALHSGALRANLERVRAVAKFAYLVFGRGALLDGPRGIFVAWWSALYPSVVLQKARRRK